MAESSYQDRLAQIRAEHAELDERYPVPDAARVSARRQVYARTLLDAVGADHEDLAEDEARYLEWLCRWDPETVAGVAALIDRARQEVPA